MLLYVVEGAVPILTGFLVWALILAKKKDYTKHKKIAMIHAITTLVSTVLVALLVWFGFKMGDGAPDWIMNIHLVFIYLIPPLLFGLIYTGMNGIRKAHIPLMSIYSLNWAAALVTGAMIFAMDRNWISF